MRHVLKVERRKLSCRDAYIVANGIESDTIALCLDREWNGLRIVLTMGEGDTAVMTEVDGGEVYVPSTLLRRPGYMPVTVAGYGDGAKRILTARADRLFRVVPSGCFDGNDPIPEQPDLLSQLLAAETGANDAAERADAAAKRVYDALEVHRGTQVTVGAGSPQIGGISGDSYVDELTGTLWVLDGE